MDVEIAVPHTPAALSPGTQTTVPVELHNPSGAALTLRLSIAPGRAGDWAVVEPATADLPPGGKQTVDVVFEPPADTTIGTAMLPFTVRVADARDDSRLGAATGLVQVSGAARVDATLTAEVGTAAVGRYALWLHNRGTTAVSLGLTARLEAAGGRAEVAPAVVEIEPGRTANARVTTRPRRRLVGAPKTYGLAVAGRDLSGDDGRQVVTVRADGAAPPRTGVTVLVAGIGAVLVAGSLVAWFAPNRLPFLDRAAPTPSATPEAAVRRPYVMVDSYPQLDPADRAAADASLARLTAVGLPVRLVDSKISDDIADGTNGFWVVLHDGFASVDEANAFCARYQGVTPRCEVVP